jgi:hypothetical protein
MRGGAGYSGSNAKNDGSNDRRRHKRKSHGDDGGTNSMLCVCRRAANCLLAER